MQNRSPHRDSIELVRDRCRDRKVSVIGAGRSGVAAARALVDLGAHVTLSDSRNASEIADAAEEALSTGARCLFGAAPVEAVPEGTDLVVTSPGVPRHAPVLQTTLARGITIWSEIELAGRLAAAPIVAVTGTNGKTTTALLVAAMLNAAGKSAVVCGNVSADSVKKTLVEAALESRAPGDILAAEVSSFQLEWVEQFAPRVAILTNVTPDHLNRHSSLEEYAETKARIFASQSPEDWAVIGYDNAASRAIGEGPIPARRIWFTVDGPPPAGEACAWLDSDRLMVRMRPRARALALLTRQEMAPTLPGRHSTANALASAAAAMAMGAPAEAIAAALRQFPGVPHRMEWVADVAGVRYVNNSMCTNVAAAISSIEAMDRPTVVIAGGADKDLDFRPLAPAMKAYARHIILIGTAADKMERAFREGGCTEISRAASLDEAVRMAAVKAKPGWAVLLSPACASFDMFRDFEARGAEFRSSVRRLEERS